MNRISRTMGMALMESAHRRLRKRGQADEFLSGLLRELRAGKVSQYSLPAPTGTPSSLYLLTLSCVVEPKSATVVYTNDPQQSVAHASPGNYCQDEVVVSAAGFSPPLWSQADLRGFWCEAIQMFAKRLVLIDFASRYEAYEPILQVAMRNGIETLDQEGAPVDLALTGD